MTADEYVDVVSKQLRELSPPKAIAFSATIAERFLPLYLKCQRYHWCYPDFAEGVLREIWEHAKGCAELSTAQIQELDEKLTDYTPNMEKCSEYDALDACSILGFALESALPQKAWACAAAAAEVAIQHVGRRADFDEADTRFTDDPRVASEVGLQRDLLGYLGGVTLVSAGTVAKLRVRAGIVG